jgi:hypothetical protein
MENRKTPEQIIGSYEKAITEDYIGLWEVVHSAKHVLKSREDNVQAVTLDLVKRMLARDFRAGYLAKSGSGFNPWPDQNAESVLRRIKAEWDELGHEPNISDICWFTRD